MPPGGSMDWERALVEDVAPRTSRPARAMDGLDARHLLGEEALVGLDLLAGPDADPCAGSRWGGRTMEPAVRGAVARARTALGFDQRNSLVRVRLEVRLEVDRRGACRVVEQRTTWRAVVDAVECFPVATLLSALPAAPLPPGERPAVAVEALRGCTLGPSYVDLGEGLSATALTFPGPLALGQEATTAHRVRVPSPSHELPAPSPQPAERAVRGCYEQQLLGPVGQVCVQVVTDPQAVPLAGEVHLRTRAGQRVEPFVLGEGSLAWSGEMPEPGELLTRWCW